MNYENFIQNFGWSYISGPSPLRDSSYHRIVDVTFSCGELLKEFVSLYKGFHPSGFRIRDPIFPTENRNALSFDRNNSAAENAAK